MMTAADVEQRLTGTMKRRSSFRDRRKMLITREDVERWLIGMMDEALEVQNPQPDKGTVLYKLEKKVSLERWEGRHFSRRSGTDPASRVPTPNGGLLDRLV
jgi:hypothetical protein